MEPRFRLALFRGIASGVTHSYFVLHRDGKVELTSNSREKPMLDVDEFFTREALPPDEDEEDAEYPIGPVDSDEEAMKN